MYIYLFIYLFIYIFIYQNNKIFIFFSFLDKYVYSLVITILIVWDHSPVSFRMLDETLRRCTWMRCLSAPL